MSDYECPVCGEPIYEAYMGSVTDMKTYNACFKCGWKEEIKPFKLLKPNKLSKALCEHFCIPCDMCQKYFKAKSWCPEEIDKCNGERHWKLLLERINSYEED